MQVKMRQLWFPWRRQKHITGQECERRERERKKCGNEKERGGKNEGGRFSLREPS